MVAEGHYRNGVLAKEVLAKHDETYMPKDVADALKSQANGKVKLVPNRQTEPPAGPGLKKLVLNGV